jgi:hypothetical protein
MADESGVEGRCLEYMEDEAANKMKTSSLLPWDRFSSWIHCICIVTFDLELGQALEVSTNATYIRAFT